MNWTVRRATTADAAAIAAVNVAGWRHAYRGIVPDGFLDRMRTSDRVPGWLRWVERACPDAVFVAVRDDGLLGAYCAVAAVRKEEDADPATATGELIALYADPAVYGGGAGPLAHNAGVDHLVACGFGHAVLWVFEGNPRARRFYEKHQWHCDEVTAELEIEGALAAEVRYSRQLSMV